MTAPSAEAKKTGFAGYRTKVLLAIMVVVTAVTAIVLYLAEENAARTVEQELQREFHAQVAGLDHLQQVRRAAIFERCRALARRPRIHAALEDNALDLLYLSAKDELRDVMNATEESADAPSYVLQARFYRFLDHQGAVIKPPSARDVGALTPEEEAQLTLPGRAKDQQIGYLVAKKNDALEFSEVIAMPIRSTDTGDEIATIVLGFKPLEVSASRFGAGIQTGVWTQGQLYLTSMGHVAHDELQRELQRAIAGADPGERRARIQLNTTPHLLFFNQLNPGSAYAPAYEVCVYPLTELVERQTRLRWQVVGAGAGLLMVALVASSFISLGLSRPVEKLAIDSAENRVQRQRAEAALQMTSAELQRAARFSADASHQLKTPVTVLRAGLEELLARPNLTAEECYEISALVHQTYRLASVIEDLLLLSRMDAGRLKLDVSPVNLSQLIEGWLDDLAALPDPLELSVETNFPSDLFISGEKRYTTLILQNLLENARKYNRKGGRIRVTAWPDREWVFLSIGNTGSSIPPDVQPHIFERFHRGHQGENVPGHGLGLNLAWELTRIHQGELRLARSENDWTEFEVRFNIAAPSRPKTEAATS